MGENTDIAERLIVTPMLDEAVQIGPASIDLRLGSDFLVVRRSEHSGIDPAKDNDARVERSQERVSVPLGEPFWLHPRHFALGATLEFIRMPPNMGAYVVGRSSWGRIGLIVATAIMVQPGYTGALTLELVNEGHTPIALYPGLRIAQLAVHLLTAKTDFPYEAGAKYVSPIGPEATKLAWDVDEIAKMRQLQDALAAIDTH
jgi:dCTP deaminase